MSENNIVIRQLGLRDYDPVWQAMKKFTDQRDATSADEIWLVEHPPVLTQGMNGKAEHLLDPGDIPVIKIDRGGQVTYHGPGQLVAYLLIDLRRLKIGIRTLVEKIEQAIIQLLADIDIEAHGRRDAPGVYVGQKKIAALGLRVRKGCSYHGLALNVKMDLSPFERINPCGYEGLEVTQTSELSDAHEIGALAKPLCQYLAEQLGYKSFCETEPENEII